MTIGLTRARTLRVVIVDDTEDLRDLLRFALVRGGMEVVGEAGDGRAGIEAVRDTVPDIVLLDLSMPIMDGLEALPKIRALAPEAKIIVLSGFEAAQMAERAVAIGADGYLQKGASLGRILDQIRDIVGTEAASESRRDLLTLTSKAELAGAPSPQVVVAKPQPETITQAPFGVLEITSDAPYRVINVNPAGQHLLGVGPSTGDLVSEVAPELLAAVVNSRLAGDNSWDASIGDRPVRVTVRHTASSLVLYLNESSGDVGNLRKAIATTAHELRGPVSVLCAITETILEDDLEPHHVTRLMTSIGRQARLLDSLTGDLLVGAQVERGTLRVDPRDIDPSLILNAVMEDHHLTQGTLEMQDHRLIRADPLRLQQMLGNLVTNAHKYGKPPIRLRVRASADHGALVCIDVEDHGLGVPEDFRPHLFREFSRAAGTAEAGTGLGLNVVQTLAQAQGGWASYAPRVGGGSVFTITLPAASR